MSTVLLKLAGPLQAWGADSRFVERKTRHEPTKSGVLGLLASALGRRRTDDISDLAKLRYGVRIDQPGYLENDFHTARKMKRNTNNGQLEPVESMPLSYRYYLSDAVFIAALEGEDAELQQYAEALLHPSFPLFLGRRSCPPAEKIFVGLYEGKCLMEALSCVPLQASKRYCSQQEMKVVLEVFRDRLPDDTGNESQESVRDIPISYSQILRDYTWRTVTRDTVTIDNPGGKHPLEHDPWSALEGV